MEVKFKQEVIGYKLNYYYIYDIIYQFSSLVKK